MTGQTDYLARAKECWGADLPDWVEALASAATAQGMRFVVKATGYAQPSLSLTISNNYGASLAGIEDKVRGALMGATVICPELGEINRNTCADWQKKPFAPTSSMRVRMHRACRSGCPNSRLSED